MVASIYKFRSGRLHGAAIADQTVAQAIELLGRGIRRADVMRQLLISERSMDRILDGTHTAIARLKKKKQRCPGCGGKLANPDKPCTLCSVRAQIGAA